LFENGNFKRNTQLQLAGWSVCIADGRRDAEGANENAKKVSGTTVPARMNNGAFITNLV
jgi:hypothetical protein